MPGSNAPSPRVVLIGCGDIAVAQHLPTIARADRGHVAAIVDPDVAHATQVGVEYGVATISTDLAAGLAAADVAVIATPPSVAPEVVIAAVDAGLDVLVEKPLATSLGDIDRVVDAVASSDRIVQVGYKNRFHPLQLTLAEWIGAGRFGEPLLVRIAIFDEDWQPENAVHTRRIQTFLDDASPVVHNGVHATDFLTWTLGSPETVVAVSQDGRTASRHPTYHAALVRYPSGAVARLEVGWWYPAHFGDELQVFGSQGIAELDRAAGRLRFRDGRSEEIISETGDWQTLAFHQQWETFMDAVERRTALGPTVGDARDALALTIAIEEAARTGLATAVSGPAGSASGAPR
jgi:predicted dehydrogenase